MDFRIIMTVVDRLDGYRRFLREQARRDGAAAPKSKIADLKSQIGTNDGDKSGGKRP